jgi:hypothetical protein
VVSLPELNNRKRYWLEIWYGDSIWKTGGPHATKYVTPEEMQRNAKK